MTKFFIYLANPSGFEENQALWDHLEDWDKKNIDPQIVKECQHDVWDDTFFDGDETVIGNVKYISIVNKEAKHIYDTEQRLVAEAFEEHRQRKLQAIQEFEEAFAPPEEEPEESHCEDLWNLHGQDGGHSRGAYPADGQPVHQSQGEAE